MSERKVLNKYYPPDFDPSKIPRMKLAKNRQYTVRLMAPFNMRCATCGEYIYKGKKFNARKEDVENEDYLGIRIYRFYIKGEFRNTLRALFSALTVEKFVPLWTDSKLPQYPREIYDVINHRHFCTVSTGLFECTRCLQEISFKTDPKNTDYEIEAGATRNFMALKLAEEQAKREEEEQKEEEANNPMKLLEYRTEQSRQEIELLESLEELKELNRRQRTVDYEGLLKQYQPETVEERKAREEQEDNEFIKSVKFNNTTKHKIVTEEIIEEVKDDEEPKAKNIKIETTTAGRPEQPTSNKKESWNRSIGVISKKPALANLVRTKKAEESCSSNVQNVVNVQKEAEKVQKDTNVCGQSSESVSAPSGLSLLANYSGSDSDSQ